VELESDAGPGGRHAVVRVVGRLGPVTATDAAGVLGVTPAAVRRHLDALVTAQLVRAHEQAGTALRGRGRPARSYVLTAAGRSAFDGAPAGWPAGDRPVTGGAEDLAADAVDYLERTSGHEAVVGFAHQRAKAMESRFAARVAAAGPDPERRTRALADALDAEGYAATARPVLTGTQLCQGRCPVHRVAAAHPELCEAEAAAFGRLVGVPVQRLATLAGGAHVCTTHVGRPLVRTSPAGTPVRTSTSTTTTTQRRPVSAGAGEDQR